LAITACVNFGYVFRPQEGNLQITYVRMCQIPRLCHIHKTLLLLLLLLLLHNSLWGALITETKMASKLR